MYICGGCDNGERKSPSAGIPKGFCKALIERRAYVAFGQKMVAAASVVRAVQQQQQQQVADM
jgi:hypothetical protein